MKGLRHHVCIACKQKLILKHLWAGNSFNSKHLSSRESAWVTKVEPEWGFSARCRCNTYGSGQPWTHMGGGPSCFQHGSQLSHGVCVNRGGGEDVAPFASLTRPYETWWPSTLMVTVIRRSGWWCLYLARGEGAVLVVGGVSTTASMNTPWLWFCKDNFRTTVGRVVSVAVA